MSAPTFEETSKFVTLPTQGKVHYNEAGEGHPIILIHGSGAGATGWANFRGNIGPLAEHFRVIAMDCIGWGLSDSRHAGETDHVAVVIELMDALGIEKAALVGNSMGGMIAIAVAARHKDRVSHLITMGPGFGLDVPNVFTPQGPSEGIKVLLEGYANPTRETMKKLTQIMAFDQKFATDELADLRANSALANPEHLANGLKSFREGGPVRNAASFKEARGITAPSLLIHGKDDRVVGYENTLRLLGCIPNARAVLLTRCGHWAQIEHEAEFNELVIDFVKKADSYAESKERNAIGG